MCPGCEAEGRECERLRGLPKINQAVLSDGQGPEEGRTGEEMNHEQAQALIEQFQHDAALAYLDKLWAAFEACKEKE